MSGSKNIFKILALIVVGFITFTAVKILIQSISVLLIGFLLPTMLTFLTLNIVHFLYNKRKLKVGANRIFTVSGLERNLPMQNKDAKIDIQEVEVYFNEINKLLQHCNSALGLYLPFTAANKISIEEGNTKIKGFLITKRETEDDLKHHILAIVEKSKENEFSKRDIPITVKNVKENEFEKFLSILSEM
ncbi:MAG: hypothetical protein ACTSSJ_01690 [Candidatus Odinarchaeia archaeon]